MKSSLSNFTDKMIAICECPIIFISYPISEEAASLFMLSEEHICIKSSLLKIIPELSILEVKLVPSVMSQAKFNLILFIITSDFPSFESKPEDDTYSTNDTLNLDRNTHEPSDFLKSQMDEMGVSQDFALELSENLAEAFAKCEFDVNDW